MIEVKKLLEGEVKILRDKHRTLLGKQREKRDTTYGMAWLAIWESQIESYERLIVGLEKKDD